MSNESDKGGTETELKLRVDDLGALMRIAVASGGTPEPSQRQTNAFFDTPDRALAMRGLVVRLREEKTTEGKKTTRRYFLTAKGPGQRSGNLTSVLEEETEIDFEAASKIRSGSDPVAPLDDPAGTEGRRFLVGMIRSTLAERALTLVGEFVNERTRVPAELVDDAVRFRAVLELDRVSFPGDQVHYEVEMEVPPGVSTDVASRAFQALFRKAGVVGRNAPGKARRFFAALRGERLDG